MKFPNKNLRSASKNLEDSPSKNFRSATMQLQDSPTANSRTVKKLSLLSSSDSQELPGKIPIQLDKNNENSTVIVSTLQQNKQINSPINAADVGVTTSPSNSSNLRRARRQLLADDTSNIEQNNNTVSLLNQEENYTYLTASYNLRDSHMKNIEADNFLTASKTLNMLEKEKRNAASSLTTTVQQLEDSGPVNSANENYVDTPRKGRNIRNVSTQEIVNHNKNLKSASKQTGISSHNSAQPPEKTKNSAATLTVEVDTEFSASVSLPHAAPEVLHKSDISKPTTSKQLTLKEFLARLSKGNLPSAPIKEKPLTNFLKDYKSPNKEKPFSTVGKRKKSLQPKINHKTLPLILNKRLFEHYCHHKVTKEAMEVVQQASEKFFAQFHNDISIILNMKKVKTGKKKVAKELIDKHHIYTLMKQLKLVTSLPHLHALMQELLPAHEWQKVVPMMYPFNDIHPLTDCDGKNE